MEKAMEEAFGHIEDPNQVLKECVEKIKAEDRTDESILTSLEVIDRLCDDVDVARNVEKLDGLQPLMDLARDQGGSIRPRTLEILALLFSNNPNIQEAGIKRGAMQVFLALTKDAPKGSDDRSKAFRALVALVRQLPAHEATFLRSEGGVALLVELLDPAEEARTREKAASFIVSLACNGEILQPEEAATIASALASLLPELGPEGVQHRETLSSCALEVARVAKSDCPSSLADAVQARLKAKEGAAREDGDDGNEEAALKECLTVLGSC